MKPVYAVKWSFITQFSYVFFYLVINVILSRILAPSDFGTFAIINIFIGFFNTIKDFGLGNYLVNKQHLTPEIKDRVFLFNGIFIVSLFVFLALLSPFIAASFHDTRLKIFIPLCSVSLLLDGLAIIPNALLLREMNFFRMFIIRTSAILIAGSVAVLLASEGWGIYSLIVQAILFSAISLIVVFWYYPYRPQRLSFSGKWKEIFTFSTPLFFDQVVQYWTRNIDNLVVGKFFGSFSLGIYNRAYTLMQMPVQNISSVVTRVLFPLLSRAQTDKDRAAEIYVKVLKGIAFFSFPLMFFVFVNADIIIHIMYGDKWSAVVPLLRIFAFAGLLESVLAPTGSLFLSFGKTLRLFKFNTLLRAFIIALILWGSLYSVKAVSLFYLAATLITTPVIFTYCARELGKGLFFIVQPLLPILCISAVAGLSAWLVRAFMTVFWPGYVVFEILLSGLGIACVYLTLSFFLTQKNFKEAFSVLHSKNN